MKWIITGLLLLVSSTCISQSDDKKKTEAADSLKRVSFTVRFHLNRMDKDDAAVLKGYVVNIGYEQAKKLDGKRIRITGYVTIITPSFERQPGQPIPQEREGPYKYIETPEIKVIRSKSRTIH